MQKRILPAVGMIIFNDAGEVLLQRRHDANQWCILSGHVEFGETVEQAAIREIKEETGCEATVVRLIGVYSSPDSQTYQYADQQIQYVTSYFEMSFTQLNPELIPNEESHDLRFFPVDQLPAELAMMHPFWLSDALNSTATAVIR